MMAHLLAPRYEYPPNATTLLPALHTFNSDNNPSLLRNPHNGRHAELPSTYRRSWATLLARVFRIDVTKCPDCGGPMRIIAALTGPSSIRHCLQGMGLPARAPPIAPARPHPQTEFDHA